MGLEVLLVLPASFLLVWSVGAFLFQFKWTCRALGWHDGKGGGNSFDGCSLHATCSKCGRKVMQDGQGNWF